MSTENELKELMGLVDRHGNACENFGDYQTIKNADACIEIRRGIETRLCALLSELEAAREDAARYRWLAVQHWVEQEATFRLGLKNVDFINTYLEELGVAIDAARKDGL